jgi:glycine/D-amino acid oxidase-like deaminating enzyme/nitrite reductase/ring-hydroxylating ferredoxin subunit
MHDSSYERLPEVPEPYWRDSVDLPKFEPLRCNMEVDVVIVGGGITGVTAAYLLSNEGLKVALLEADKLLNGTTGHTTAKITAQHSLIYDELINHMGKYKARLYYESNMDALNFIRKTVQDHQIQCDFEEQDAYIYATTEEYANKLIQEFSAYQDLGIDGELLDKIPFDFQVKNALCMKNQAQFHPLKYLAHLLEEIVDHGGLIFEDTTADHIIFDGDHPTVVTRQGSRITGDKVLICSHFPFYDTGFYFSKMYAERAYVIAAKTDKAYPGGMYISAETPTRSFRSVTINNEPMVLIIGESHKAGQGKDTLEHYQALESFAQEVLGVKKIPYRWSTQDLTTLDKVAYVGEMSLGQENVLVATGYKKWGMTTGTAAALLLRDIVLKRDNRYTELYSPSRFYADPSLKTFFAQNLDVAAHLIKGKFEFPLKKAEDLDYGHGSVITFNGSRAGAYKDQQGDLYIVDTTCTHMGCEVEWNHGDLTWDCPCHGSRFSYTGDVLEGPAKKPLRRLN